MDFEQEQQFVADIKEYVTNNLSLSQMSDDELEGKIEEIVLQRIGNQYCSIDQKVSIVQQVYSSIRGFGLLDTILNDDSITEVMINGPKNVFIEQNGRLFKLDKQFESQRKLEDVIQRITTFFHTSPDVKNREIRLEWSGDKRALPTAEEEISRVQASIIKWYASEYHNGRQVLDEIQTPSAINSELYTKMIYLTRNWSLYPNGDGCVTISSPEIKNKYPAAICLALGFFLSIVISVMFCLVKKMVDEYQQNSGQ